MKDVQFFTLISVVAYTLKSCCSFLDVIISKITSLEDTGRYETFYTYIALTAKDFLS